MNGKIALLVVFSILSVCCFGEDAEVATGAPSANVALTQTLLGLGIVIGLILVLAWFAKRLNVAGMNQNHKIKVVTAVPLGTREKAVLIDVQGKQLLVGVAPGRVSTLHVFDQVNADSDDDSNDSEGSSSTSPDQKNRGLMRSSLSANSASEFSRKLNTFLGSGSK